MPGLMALDVIPVAAGVLARPTARLRFADLGAEAMGRGGRSIGRGGELSCAIVGARKRPLHRLARHEHEIEGVARLRSGF
jgi:hypothetical protein